MEDRVKKHYFVTWDFEFLPEDEVETPREAAERCQEILRRPNSIANIFTVKDLNTGKEYTVDLDE